jgi:hypothetical protein
MRTTLILLFLVAYGWAAEPTSQPAVLSPSEYAAALLGIHRHEERLLKRAANPSLPYCERQLAISAAICNKWRGPFRLHEFAFWLRKNGLVENVRVRDEIGDVEPRFLDPLPEGFSSLLLDFATPPGTVDLHVAEIAVDANLSAEDVERILEDKTETGIGKTPIVYDLRAVAAPPGFGRPD